MSKDTLSHAADAGVAEEPQATGDHSRREVLSRLSKAAYAAPLTVALLSAQAQALSV